MKRLIIEAEFKLDTLSAMGEREVKEALNEFRQSLEHLLKVTRAEIKDSAA